MWGTVLAHIESRRLASSHGQVDGTLPKLPPRAFRRCSASATLAPSSPPRNARGTMGKGSNASKNAREDTAGRPRPAVAANSGRPLAAVPPNPFFAPFHRATIAGARKDKAKRDDKIARAQAGEFRAGCFRSAPGSRCLLWCSRVSLRSPCSHAAGGGGKAGIAKRSGVIDNKCALCMVSRQCLLRLLRRSECSDIAQTLLLARGFP